MQMRNCIDIAFMSHFGHTIIIAEIMRVLTGLKVLAILFLGPRTTARICYLASAIFTTFNIAN